MGVKVAVNGRYPDAMPMSTMPPDMLAALPTLPEDLEYRFVGNRLMLLDVQSHLIIDFVTTRSTCEEAARVIRSPKALALVAHRRLQHAGERLADSHRKITAIPLTMPNKAGSLKFGVLGDFGTGEPPQYQMAAQMARVQQSSSSIWCCWSATTCTGRSARRTSSRSSSIPTSRCSMPVSSSAPPLGNHDSREQRKYPNFNMNGELYYSFKAPSESVRFFALESTYMEPQQTRLVGEAAEELDRGLEDCVLPSSSVFLRRPARIRRAASREDSSRCSSPTT